MCTNVSANQPAHGLLSYNAHLFESQRFHTKVFILPFDSQSNLQVNQPISEIN